MNIEKEKTWYLGDTFDGKQVYIEDFKWVCNWYWSGGHIVGHDFSSHFDNCFLKIPDVRGHSLGNFTTPANKTEKSKILQNYAAVWEPLDFFLDNAQYNEEEWWRIKDLFKQFYTLRDAAEVFQYGGNCTPKNRNSLEINKEMAAKINHHIETIIIPEIRKVLDKK